MNGRPGGGGGSESPIQPYLIRSGPVRVSERLKSYLEACKAQGLINAPDCALAAVDSRKNSKVPLVDEQARHDRPLITGGQMTGRSRSALPHHKVCDAAS